MPKPDHRKIIAVDIDDVLAANAEGFVEFSNSRWGTHLKAEDYTEHWAELWGIERDDAERRRETILNKKLFVSYKFFDDAMPVLKKLKGEVYRLVVVSSRGSRVQKDTVDWLKKEYGTIFDGIYFADMWDRKDISLEERLKRTKIDVLKRVQADFLIDDQPKHCIVAAESGITALLFGDYKCNRGIKMIQNMVRVKNWGEVGEYFDAQS